MIEINMFQKKHYWQIKNLSIILDNLYILWELHYTMDEKQEIPKEIDDHYKLFGKEPWEIEYGDKCPICNSRFDEFEGCACDSKGD